MISRRGVGEEIGRIQQRPIPDFVKIPVKPVGAGLGHIVDLRRSVSSLIHGIGQSVNRDFGNRVKPKHEIGRKTAIEVRERVIRLQPIDDVAVGQRGQAIEFHVAISVRTADKIIAVPRGVDQGARGELQWVGQIPAGVGKVFERRSGERGGGIGVFRVDQRSGSTHLYGLLHGRNFQDKVDRLLLPEARHHMVNLLRLEALRFQFDGVSARTQLGEIEAALIVCPYMTFEAGFGIYDRHGGVGDGGMGRVSDFAHNGAGGFALRHNPGGGKNKRTNNQWAERQNAPAFFDAPSSFPCPHNCVLHPLPSLLYPGYLFCVNHS